MTHNKPTESLSEARYRLAVRAAHGVIWDWDIVEGKVLWGESIRAVMGYPAGEDGIVVADNSGWWRDKIHPDDCGRVIGDLEECVRRSGAASAGDTARGASRNFVGAGRRASAARDR